MPVTKPLRDVGKHLMSWLQDIRPPAGRDAEQQMREAFRASAEKLRGDREAGKLVKRGRLGRRPAQVPLEEVGKVPTLPFGLRSKRAAFSDKKLDELQRLRVLLRALDESDVEDTIYVPMKKLIDPTMPDSPKSWVSVNYPLKEAEEKYLSDPGSYQFIEAPTGRAKRVRQAPEGPGVRAEKIRIQSLAPALKRVEAKERPIVRKKLVGKKAKMMQTKEGMAWLDIKDRPDEAGFWRRMLRSQPAAPGREPRKTSDFFMRMYKAYRADRFAFAKKRRAEAMIRKFQEYEK